MNWIKKKLNLMKRLYGRSFAAEAKEYLMNVPVQYRKGYMTKLRRAYLTYGVTPEEYVKFRFFEKTEEERMTYMSHKEEVSRYLYTSANQFPRHKYKRYQCFSSSFLRDVLYVSETDSDGADDHAYLKFCQKNTRFIIKPIKGTEGQGIRIVEASEFDSLKKLISYAGDELLLEGLISQGRELAQFHPSSVNTLRLVSALDENGKYSILFALLRVGMGGSVVDNVGAGGLVARIDPDTGIVVTDALCGTNSYKQHPDTGIQFQGFAMPEWEAVCRIAEDAHRTLPGQRMIGWDFAWTEIGRWDVVEANPLPSFISYQTLAGEGIRSTLKEAGIL